MGCCGYDNIRDKINSEINDLKSQISSKEYIKKMHENSMQKTSEIISQKLENENNLRDITEIKEYYNQLAHDFEINQKLSSLKTEKESLNNLTNKINKFEKGGKISKEEKKNFDPEKEYNEITNSFLRTDRKDEGNNYLSTINQELENYFNLNDKINIELNKINDRKKTFKNKLKKKRGF